MKKTIYMIFMFAVVLISSAYALEVSSPEQGYVYNTSTIGIVVESNEILDMLNYSIDSGDLIVACENCSEFESVANLSEGNHSMEFIAWKGNESETVLIDFRIELPDSDDENETDENETEEDYDLLDTLEVISPIEDYEYNTTIIDLKVDVNGTLDMLNYSIDDSSHVIACENCSVFESEVNLSEGDHTIEFFAWSGNDSKRIEVDFSIELPDSDDDENETDDDQDDEDEKDYSPKNESYGQPRFDLGFEKLPQAFESGEITDDELADIIRDNKINPGILNRLIKTGKLGNESLEAILDTQFQPQGLFRRILSFIGLGEDSYAEQIYENYNVSEKLQQKLLEREDLPRGQAKKLQEQMQEKIESRTRGNQQADAGSNGNSQSEQKNTIQIGQQENPGKGNSNGNGKNLDAPGQSNKGGNPGKGNGRN